MEARFLKLYGLLFVPASCLHITQSHSGAGLSLTFRIQIEGNVDLQIYKAKYFIIYDQQRIDPKITCREVNLCHNQDNREWTQLLRLVEDSLTIEVTEWRCSISSSNEERDSGDEVAKQTN